MTIGYLHVGPPEHGVHRYGALLDEAAQAHLDANVIRAHAIINRSPFTALRAALDALAAADVIHVQYEPISWGDVQAPAAIEHLIDHTPAPLVVTVHDARAGYTWLNRVQHLWAARSSSPSFRTVDDAPSSSPPSWWMQWGAKAERAWQFWRRESANARATRGILNAAAAVLVCTSTEHARLEPLATGPRIKHIPHFVESRTLPRRSIARAELDIPESTQLITVLGFIHRQKGHDRVVEALSHLPNSVRAAFVGAPSDPGDRYATALHQQARERGVAERIRCTGYVQEATLNQYLAVTDVAVCPFREATASGSLSTWIAAGRPLVVADLPLFDSYEATAQAAFERVLEDTPEAWAGAIDRHLSRGATPEAQSALRNLQERLALSTIIHEHATVYTHVAS